MDTLRWMVVPLQRYAVFTGRAHRLEYWMFILGYAILAVPLMLLAEDPAGAGGLTLPTAALILLILATFVPTLAVQVRRFHDINASGWMVLWNLIPYVGWIIVLAAMCRDGTIGANRFGVDPRPRTSDMYDLFH